MARDPEFHFADESKAKTYLMAVAVIPGSQVSRVRADLMGLRIGGQAALHFKRESDRRRKVILASLIEQGWKARIFRSEAPAEVDARIECLGDIVGFALQRSAQRLTVELDTSIAQSDHRNLYRLTRHLGSDSLLTYALQPRHSEPGLWAADAIAWSYARGDHWRQRIRGMLIPTAP